MKSACLMRLFLLKNKLYTNEIAITYRKLKYLTRVYKWRICTLM